MSAEKSRKDKPARAFTLLIPDATKQILQVLADSAGVTLSEYVQGLVKEAAANKSAEDPK